MLTKEEILARKNVMKAAGKNIVIDESWGPLLEKIWLSFAPNTYLTSEIKNTDGQNNKDVTAQKPTNNAKWYNPLTWLGGISYALTKDMGREEKQQFFNNHPYLYLFDLQNEQYAQGKGLAKGVEILATAASTASIPRLIRQAPVLIGKTTSVVPAITSAAKSVISAAKASPIRWAGKQLANWFVLPELGGAAVNKGTEIITNSTLGVKRNFDELASGALGTFLGPMANPGYLLNLAGTINVKSKIHDKVQRAIKYATKSNKIQQELSSIKIDPSFTQTITDLVDGFTIKDIDRGTMYSDPAFTGKATASNPETKFISHTTKTAHGPYGTTSEYTLPLVITGNNDELIFDNGKLVSQKLDKKIITDLPFYHGDFSDVTHGYKLVQENIQKIIGEDGIITGSTELYSSGIIPGAIPAHDIEFITTQTRLKDLENKLLFEGDWNPNYNYVKKGISDTISDYNNGLTDILVIQETNGKASGLIAHEIYAFLHPGEYAKLRNQHAKNIWDVLNMRQYSIFEMPDYLYDFELPISAELLYQEFRQSPKKLNKTLSDQFILDGQKYQNRVTEIFYDPERLKQSREAIDNKMIEIFGDTYQKPREIYNNFDFDNLESNSKLLLHVLHISKERADELAKNKEYVKDIFDLYINNITISFRRSFNSGNKTSPTRLGIDDVMLRVTGNLGGGSDHGVGGNMVRIFAGNADGVYYGPFGVVTQQKITFHPEKIKTFDDLINQIDHLTKNNSEIYNMLENTYDTKAAFNRNKSNAYKIMDEIGEEAIRQDLPFWIPLEISTLNNMLHGYLGLLDRSADKQYGYWYGRKGYQIDVPGLYSMNSILTNLPTLLTEQQLKQANEQGFYTVLNELLQNEHYPTYPYLSRTKDGTTFLFNFDGVNREAKKYMLNKDIINILSNKIGEEQTNKIIRKNLQEAFKNHLINKEQIQSLLNKGLEEIANLDKRISDGIIRDMRNYIIKNNKKSKTKYQNILRIKNLRKQLKQLGTIPIQRVRWINPDGQYNIPLMQQSLYNQVQIPSGLPMITNGILKQKDED